MRKLLTLLIMLGTCVSALAQRLDFTETTTHTLQPGLFVSYASDNRTFLLNEINVFEITYKLPFKLPNISIGHGGLVGMELTGFQLEQQSEIWGYEIYGKAQLGNSPLYGKIGWGPLIDVDKQVSWPLRAEFGLQFQF